MVSFFFIFKFVLEMCDFFKFLFLALFGVKGLTDRLMIIYPVLLAHRHSDSLKVIVKLNWPENADSSLFPSVAREYTAEMRGSPPSSSTITLSSRTGAWPSDPVINTADSSCLLWPFTGTSPMWVAMVTLFCGREKQNIIWITVVIAKPYIAVATITWTE